MNYSLAKSLKDTGFPQNSMSKSQTFIDDPTGASDLLFAVPTLEELISAVDDLKFTILHDKDGWYAENEKGLSASNCKSPEEAVAQLWITTAVHNSVSSV